MSKLSVLVATKVMGWPTIHEDEPLRLYMQYGGYICNDTAHLRIRGIETKYFRPDNDIADAWAVVEYITNPKANVRGPGGLPASTVFGYTFDKEHLWACDAKEAAMQICILALRAVGVPDAEIGEALK